MNESHTLEDIYHILDSIQPDEYGCKNWPGMRGDNPRGFYGGARIEGTWIRIHRVALERKMGRKIKPGLFACHSCDNPSCVTPEHLYEGTHADNMRDACERNPPEVWKYRIEALRKYKERLKTEKKS